MLSLLRSLSPSLAVRDVDLSVHRCCQAMRWLVTVRFGRERCDR